MTREARLMGTSVLLQTEASDRRAGLEELEGLLIRLEQSERSLSTWQEESDLARWNRQALNQPFPVQEELCLLFQELRYWVEATGAAFDPAIGSLLDLWGVRLGRESWPSGQEIETALEVSGMRHLRLDPQTCQLTRLRGVILDAGAFGKGAALERALLRAREEGWSGWMINFGGQILVEGGAGSKPGWQVSLADPVLRDRAVLDLWMTSGSLATSGVSEKAYWIQGIPVSHIISPRTGRPAGFQGSVAVWHERALVADILSTALLVMGPEEGLPWAEARGILACYLIPRPDPAGEGPGLEILPTHSFRARFLDPSWKE